MINILRLERCRPIVRLLNELSSTGRMFSSSNDNDDKKKTRQEAALKLQNLLTQLATDEKERTVEKSEVKITRPVRKRVEDRPVYKIKLDKIPDKLTAKLVAAVKDVADHVGGPDVKSTEKELLHVILNNNRQEAANGDDLKLNSVLSGMQVEKEKDSRAVQVRRSMPQERSERPKTVPKTRRDRGGTSTLDLFKQKPLGIFPANFQGKQPPFELPIWSKMVDKELKLLVTHPPSNIYEDMIQWTERGQLWTFPIDNEQGLEEEKKIDFTQHVFLDEHLEPWCPAKGPLRHFMDLVVVGLSKNPYITVQAKIANILWYRDYFESKKKLLMEVGAFPVEEPKKEIPAS